MTILQSIILGLVEGLTEFIPVSSTGHMLLIQRLLGIGASNSMFTYLVLIQLGAIGALLVYFGRDFWELVKAFFAAPFSTTANRMAWFVILATIPGLLAGALLRDVALQLFSDPLREAAIRFLTAGVLLGLAEWLGHRRRKLDSMTWLDSVIIGLFQVLAVFPGASRSGASISGGMLQHFDRASATRFAFLMSAPIMIAAGAYETVGAVRGGELGSLLPVLPLGILVAGLAGWFSIRWLINFVSGHRLYWFAGYCLLLGAGCLTVLHA